MHELIQAANFSRAEHFCAVRLNPRNIPGLRLAMQVRILIFKEPESAKLQIDFAAQTIRTDHIYVIPAFHFYELSTSPACRLICIDLDDDLLPAATRQCVYPIFFLRDKSVSLPFSNVYEQLRALHSFAPDELPHSLPVVATMQWLEHYCAANAATTPAKTPPAYLRLAYSFLHVLNKTKLDLYDCTVARFAEELDCSEKSLNRMCRAVFQTGTQDILKQRLAMKAIFLLKQQILSLKQISALLGFAHTASFYRYIKRYLDE